MILWRIKYSVARHNYYAYLCARFTVFIFERNIYMFTSTSSPFCHLSVWSDSYKDQTKNLGIIWENLPLTAIFSTDLRMKIIYDIEKINLPSHGPVMN